MIRILVMAALLTTQLAGSAQSVPSQTAVSLAATAPTVVPALVPYSGFAVAEDNKPLRGELAMTFQIFMDPTGGEALFTETQMVLIDSLGHYTAHLGASHPMGLPAGLFSTGQARWLEVQIAGQVAQPRILLASVPYALKSADSATLGGLPASAFVLASGSADLARPSAAISPDTITTVTTTGGTSNKLAKFSGASTIVSSVIYDNGTEVGIGTTSPTATLTVTGTATVNGATAFNGSVSLNALGTATSSAADDSQQLKMYASAYNSSSKTAVAPHFIWQAEPTGNNTSSPGATLNLLATAGSSASETGFYFNTNGTMHFASGQTFPAGTGGGSGTITGVTAGTALTGGGSSGTVTLNVDTTKVPLLASSNTFSGATQTISNNLVLGGTLGVGTSDPQGSIDVEGSDMEGIHVDVESTNSSALSVIGGNNGGIAAQFYAQDGATTEGGQAISVIGGYGESTYAGGAGGVFSGGNTDSATGGYGIWAFPGNYNSDPSFNGPAGPAGVFEGDVFVSGTLSAGAKNFRIDHPLDPATKYLNHASIESSEMMNMYTGNVTTDGNGLSVVSLPAWFEAINTDFRYQLTVVGQFAQAIIKSKVAGGRFTIMTNAPGVEVSWQITAVRQDPYAKAHPMTVEQTKPANEQGFYIHPELYGQPRQKQTEWGRHPVQMQRMEAMRSGRKAGPTVGRVQQPQQPQKATAGRR